MLKARVVSTQVFTVAVLQPTNLNLDLPVTATCVGRIKNQSLRSALMELLACNNTTLCSVSLRGIPTIDGCTNFRSTGKNALVSLITLSKDKNRNAGLPAEYSNLFCQDTGFSFNKID